MTTETKSPVWKFPLLTLILIVFIGWLGVTVYQNATQADAQKPFKLGLDLAGGSHLVYSADVSGIAAEEADDAMAVLKDVIERRVNIFGVSEPLVQVEKSSIISGDVQHRLVVELPGVTDIDEAIRQIGETPLLEFKLIDQQALAAAQAREQLASSTEDGLVIDNVTINGATSSEPYVATGLTGRYLVDATLDFVGQQQGISTGMPIVSIRFNDEGAALFEQITRDNVGEQLAIFLDGGLMSAPNINEPIAGGQAVISGGFTVEEAKMLAQNLSFGALPVPIALESTQTIDASLGAGVLQQAIAAGVLALVMIGVFMIFWYRLPGLIAFAALGAYLVCMLALFQFIPVTLTAAGLAGLVLSLGMAVDANVLVFERVKEEILAGKKSHEATRIGFSRAWSAIRDGNITSLLSALILFWFGTSLVKGFALVFGLGVIVSMITIIIVSRTLLLTLPDKEASNKTWRFLLGNGLKR